MEGNVYQVKDTKFPINVGFSDTFSCSFIYSFIYLFIYSFIYLFIYFMVFSGKGEVVYNANRKLMLCI